MRLEGLIPWDITLAMSYLLQGQGALWTELWVTGKRPLASNVNLITVYSHCLSLRTSFSYTRFCSLSV